MINDVIIIGGGASGLCAAVYLKQKMPSLSIRILESQPRVGKKLALTGNGRCNITNKNISLSAYHGKDTNFAEYALSKYDRYFCENFFEKIGVPFAFEGDKGYPASFQAGSVVDCLRFAVEELDITLNLETKVTNIQMANGNYKVIADNLSFLSRNLIVAAGLLSGGERLGCDGGMLSIIKKAGFETVDTKPAIVQVKTETDIVKQLKGIKNDALVTLKCEGKTVRQEFGETLFCDYGLSGPPVLQVSRGIDAKKKCEISLDLMNNTDYNTLLLNLENRVKALKSRNLDEFFTGMLNKRLGQVIIKSAGLKLSDSVSSLKIQDLKKIASAIKNFSFTVTGTTGYLNSQVTAGGLATSEFDSKTMMSKSAKGLYAVGEILDIDGDCGGFNLQWAWSSAMCAADSIIEGIK